MPLTNRRQLFRAAAALPFAVQSTLKPLRIGITDWNLYADADPAAVALASRLGFDGVQISFGRKLIDGKLPVDNPAIIERYRQQSRQYGLPIDGTCVDRLHDNGLKNDPLAARWVDDSIRLTHALGVRVLLVPFFGKQKMETVTDRERVGDALRELAPHAERANVILGIEDTISARDNVWIAERSRSPNVLTYYDVGNSTNNGFNVVEEIRWLGAARICQIHLKDNPHWMGEGTIQFGPVIQAIHDIGFTGYANLETDVTKNNLDAGLKRNLAFIRGTIDKTYRT